MKLLVITVFLILVTLPVPAAAGTLSFDVSGVLGPVLQGPDPIQLAGATFTATGAIDPEALPIGISGDSATYDLAGNLQITAGTFILTGYDAMLTMTAPPSGPDTLFLDLRVTEYGFTPEIAAFFRLPSGTLNGTEIQKFWAEVNQPDGSLSFSLVPDMEGTLSGTVGITGSVSIGGTPSSSAPEPGTAGLLAAGLVLAIAMKMRVPSK
jgi:hypothetical protein